MATQLVRSGAAVSLVVLFFVYGCGETHTGEDSGPVDSSTRDSAIADSGRRDSAPTDSAPADSAPADSAPADSAPADSATTDGAPVDGGDAGPDAAAITHYGIVRIGAGDFGGFGAQITGAFVPATDLFLVTMQRLAIAGAPGCYEVLAPPPVVPRYLDAGTLSFTGLTIASLDVAPDTDDFYVFSYASLFETPDDPIALSVPGGAEIEPGSAVVATPDLIADAHWSLGSTGIGTTWTPGNGDSVLLLFSTSAGARVCETPDSGAFIIPAPAYSPDAAPLGDQIRIERVIEVREPSATGSQELRLRAYTSGELAPL